MISGEFSLLFLWSTCCCIPHWNSETFSLIPPWGGFHVWGNFSFLITPSLRCRSPSINHLPLYLSLSFSLPHSDLPLGGSEVFCRRKLRFNQWVRKIPWRRKWQPTPVFLPGKLHGQRSLVGYSSWDCKESDTTERLTHISFWGDWLAFLEVWSNVLLFLKVFCRNCSTEMYFWFCGEEGDGSILLLHHIESCHLPPNANF